MKIRIFSPKWPFPVREGAHFIIAEQLIDLIRNGNEVEFWCWDIKNGPQECPLPLIKVIRPTSGQSVKGPVRAMLRKIAGIHRSSSGEIAHYPEVVAKEILASEALTPVDLSIFHYSFAFAWISKFRKAAFKSQKLCVVFHNFENVLYAGKANRAKGLLRRVFDHHNARLLLKHEQALLASDLIDEATFLSATDAKEARNFASDQLLIKHELPARLRSGVAPQKDRARNCDVLLIGAFDFWPNLESLTWLIEEVFPKVAVTWTASSSGRVKIIGKGIPKWAEKKLEPFAFVEQFGFVSDLNAIYRNAALCLAPELGGTGFRVKILEALFKGIPVLSHNETAKRLGQYKISASQLILSDSGAEWASLISNSLERKKA